MALYGIVFTCMELYGIVFTCMVLYGIVFTSVHGTVWDGIIYRHVIICESISIFLLFCLIEFTILF